ncbi:MAG: hypothetical protein QXT28_10460 [Thermofilaceae archaeon]
MERLLLYLVVAAAVLAALSAARLRQQPDYCSEAERLAAAVLAVSQSGGWVVDTFTLDRVVVNSTGLYHPGCGVAARLPVANSTILSGRVRLEISWGTGVVLRRR